MLRIDPAQPGCISKHALDPMPRIPPPLQSFIQNRYDDDVSERH
jgi:hypothetical protein